MASTNPFSAAIEKAYRAAAEEKAKYPRLARMLGDAGVRRYVVDVASGTITYLGESARERDTHPGKDARAIAKEFSEKKAIEALRATQAGKSSYSQFLDGIAAAGIVTYFADLEHARISYLGHGRVYEEEIPRAP